MSPDSPGFFSDSDLPRALEEALQFDQLVREMAARFVNLPPDELDSAIQDAQRRILDALDLDRSAVFQSVGGHDLVMTHHWAREGLPTILPAVSATREFPWSLGKIRSGEIACFSSIDEVPEAVERDALTRYGTKSRVACPLSIDGRVVGALAFSANRVARSWPPAIVGRMRLVAEVFSSALARKRAHLAARTSEKLFQTLADNVPAMIRIQGPSRTCTWVSRQWLELVGATLDQELGDGWIRHVHPDDVDGCVEAQAKHFPGCEPYSLNYRVRRNDGTWRWVLDRSTPTHEADGAFTGYLCLCVDVTEQVQATHEVERSRDKLRAENVRLRRQVKDRLSAGVIVGQSEAIRRVLAQVEQVAGTNSTVLLLGETGTGKELFATRIHELSARRMRQMVRVNCSAIPSTLIESELFGREKGAFTGALARQAGRFEFADQSTIFLDEIGDLPPDVQIKLLRVIEERQIERLGSPRAISVDTRIIAATHRNLELRIAEGAFREDLFYRLNVFPIEVPALRDRAEDIPLLVWRFVEEFSQRFSKRVDSIPNDNLAELQRYVWPGNIRELRNVVERAMIVATGPELRIDLPVPAYGAGTRSVSLVEVEREHIRGVLERAGWRIRGPAGAAARLGLPPTTLETRMAKLGLSRRRPES